MRSAMEDGDMVEILGANGMRAAGMRYNWELAEKDLVSAYRQIL